MILWCDGCHDAVENMRRDAALLAACEARTRAGEAPEPVLRLFGFDPAGITLGHAQTPERVLDLERCRADGISWAVRPTGGRAIFHAEEWTYSLSAALADPEWGGSLATAYARTSTLIAASLRRLGVPAELARASTSRDAGASPACFASTARHEIVLEGRKLVGSAQRRTAWALLQQGSVLLGGGHRRLADYVTLSGPGRERVRRHLADTADASPWIGTDLGLARWAAALAAELGPGVRTIAGAAGEFSLLRGRSGGESEGDGAVGATRPWGAADG